MRLSLAVVLLHASDDVMTNLILTRAGARDVRVTRLDVMMTDVVLVRTDTAYVLSITTGPMCECECGPTLDTHTCTTGCLVLWFLGPAATAAAAALAVTLTWSLSLRLVLDLTLSLSLRPAVVLDLALRVG